MSFPWAYIDIHSSLSASGPTGSIQFRGGDAGPYSTLTGSHNLMFYTASSLLALTGNIELVGTASANQFNLLSQSVVTTNFSASGDTIFGNTTDDTHQFTGSFRTHFSGGLAVGGDDADGTRRYVSITGSDFDALQSTPVLELTSSAEQSMLVLNGQDTDALKQIVFKKAGTTQTSIGVDSDEHFTIENESTKDIILRTQNQNTIRIFGNQQAVEINGAGTTANATLDVNGSTNITSSLTVSGTVAFCDRRRQQDVSDTAGGGVLNVSGSLTSSKGIHFGEAAADPILVDLDKKILFTGSAPPSDSAFIMSGSGNHLAISGSNVSGMILKGARIGLDHRDAIGDLSAERGLVLTGSLAGPNSHLGLDSTNKVILAPQPSPSGPNTSVLFNKSAAHSGSGNLKIGYQDNGIDVNKLTHVGKFQVKSGSSPATAPVVFEVVQSATGVEWRDRYGDQGYRAKGKFYHIYSVNFSLTSVAQANTGRFVNLPTGEKGHVGTGTGVFPYYGGALNNSKAIMNPSSGRVIMLMYRFSDDFYHPTAESNPPLFFMRVSALPFSNGTAGGSISTTAGGVSVIHSVTASSHPGPNVVGGIDFRTGVGAEAGHGNITGSWAFGTGSLMNLHIRTPGGQNAPGNAYLTIVCEYDHLDEYVSGSGN